MKLDRRLSDTMAFIRMWMMAEFVSTISSDGNVKRLPSPPWIVRQLLGWPIYLAIYSIRAIARAYEALTEAPEERVRRETRESVEKWYRERKKDWRE